MEPAVKRYIC